MGDVMGSAVRNRAIVTHGSSELPAIGVVDPASDMWAIGVIAWALFTGKPLFPASTPDTEVVAMLMGTKLLPFEQDPGLWMQFDKAQVGPHILLVCQQCPLVKHLHGRKMFGLPHQ